DGALLSVSSGTFVTDSSQPGFAWTRISGYVPLQSTYTIVIPDEISATGNVIIGQVDFPFSAGDAFRWTPNGGMQLLGTTSDAYRNSEAGATNADGSLIVGSYTATTGAAVFRWTEATGMLPFDDGPGTGTMI